MYALRMPFYPPGPPAPPPAMMSHAPYYDLGGYDMPQAMPPMPHAMGMHAPYNPMGMDPTGMQGMMGMDMSGMAMAGMPAMNGYMTGMPSNAGCVKIRGLPYRATVNDIADFFNGFAFNRETIQISMGYDGRSTGEGWITFDTPEEASRAVSMRNGQNIGNRYVELYMV
uniref:RRM domain-containing protein n=1 Tax=Guillardia theta TaxID=55529 RepID=A0A7S4KU19_GUITH